MDTLTIGSHSIGPDHPTFIIAEAGVNHNGDPALARQLIDAAAEAGVQAVKFQTFKAEKLVTKQAKMAEYQVRNTGEETSQLEMLRKLELEYDAHRALKEYAEAKGLVFLSTPFDNEGIDFLANLGVAAFKAGSGDLTNIPYLEKMASKGLPLIISTGMANMEESREAVETLRKSGNLEFAVLHCTSNYPCPLEEVNLAAMQTLARELDVMVGYSDHTAGIQVPVMAVAAGAQIIEKHFTLDKGMEGPDHAASLDPVELKEMVEQIRRVEMVMGTGAKLPNPSEEKIKEQVRKSVVAAVEIEAGAVVEEEMLTVKRPGTGLHPRYLKQFQGKRATRRIEVDEMVQENDFE